MSTTTAKGLPGIIARARAALDKPELWLVRCVLIASLIAVVYYSGDKAKDGPTQAILIFLGFAAVGFHYVGAQRACRSWFERQAGAFIAWTLVICGAVAWEMNSQIGIASNNQANLSTAALTAATVSEDARKTVADAEAEIARLEASRAALEPLPGVANVKPWRTPQDAQAAVSTAEAHVRFRQSESCTKAQGATQRKFCADYQSAKAEVARWSELKEIGIALTAAKERASEARKASAAAPVVASSERGDFRNLKRLTALSDADLELSQSLLTVIVMSLFLTVAGWLIKAEE